MEKLTISSDNFFISTITEIRAVELVVFIETWVEFLYYSINSLHGKVSEKGVEYVEQN